MKSVLKINLVVLLFVAATLNAAEIKNLKPNQNNQGYNGNPTEFASTCKAATQSADLDINNVRTKILNGGDMWWDLNNPRYEIPKVTDANSVRKHSLFAGALWIGGLGRGDGNLRIAAMTYRQTGNDFWPGTLDFNDVSTDPARCESWDKMFKTSRADILRAYLSEGSDIPPSVLEWPGYGSISAPFHNNQTTSLAPFFNADGTPPRPGDNLYQPESGDYPVLDITRSPTQNLPKDQPDQMIWFVYNDRGNVHSETGGIPIGLEIQTIAFAFATNDEVNNMTFYTNTIINRGFEPLDETYFGQWVDADLGNYSDDYVGCDVGRSLGYCYNGDDNDEGVLGYGNNPPSIGVDFFEGPIDTSGKQLGMEAFVYYNNNSDPINGNPRQAIDFYNYLKAKWKNGNDITFGGNGIGGSNKTKYMFDDGTNSATSNLPKWNERSAGNQPADRRFLQSAGPFTLMPGAVNKITVGVVWARTTSGGATGSLNLLKLASDKAQKLFNNKFNLPSGPEPPTVEMQQLNNELVLKFYNTSVPTNYKEQIKDENGNVLEYRFQGYLIYQIKDGTVSSSEVDNIEKARLIAQCDVKDDITTLINMEFDPTVSASIPRLKVDGANQGIFNSLSIKTDAFAEGSNKNLVNFKTYYYLLMTYGYPSNDPLKLDPVQFLAGRNTVKISGVPRNPMPQEFGSDVKSNYGDGPMLKKLSGKGNGSQVLEFTKETIDEILKNGKSDEPVYMGGKGPINIKVIDPIKVPNAEFEFVFIELKNDIPNLRGSGAARMTDSISAKSYWKLTNKTTGDVVYSDTTIAYKYESTQGREKLFGKTKTVNSLKDWGLSVDILQTPNPGTEPYAEPNAGFLGFDVTFSDLSNQWLTAVPDIDIENSPFNWIRSGTNGMSTATFDPYNHDFRSELTASHNGDDAFDPYENFEKIWDRRIAPYALCSRAQGPSPRGVVLYAPAWSGSNVLDNPLSELSSVRVVLTPDVRLWTKCVVLEMAEDVLLAEGGVAKFNPRSAPSKTPRHNGNGELTGWDVSSTETGRSYFPGYAINIETGERLNIMFGEDSYLGTENGRDMIWNPTSVFNDLGTYFSFGGKHNIYIMGSYSGMPGRSYKGPIYDGGDAYMALFAQNNITRKREVFSQCMWVIPAMAAQGFDLKKGIPINEVTINLYTRKAYNRIGSDTTANGLPRYTFKTESIMNNINKETGKKAVDLINIVPNPYYASSKYESGPIDNRVKITNLPPKATISIYTLSGTLVRRIKKDDPSTWVDWDLKNDNRVPISSGLFIIHVDCGDLGEKILKWYGVMRQLDLDTY